MTTVIILAGGKGARMNGDDKGWIDYRGEPLISHAIKIASSVSDQVIISCNRNLSDYESLGYPCVTDRESGYLGPLMGILSAGRLVRTGDFCVLPCDMPYMKGSILRRLMDVLDSTDRETAVAHDGTRLQSLVFAANQQLIDSIEEKLKKNHRSARRWLLSTNYQEVLFADSSAFANLNSADQVKLQR